MKEKIIFTAGGQVFEYPESMTKDIDYIEARVLGTLANDLSLLKEFDMLNASMFHTNDGFIYFNLMYDMFEHGAVTFDNGAMTSSLNRLGKTYQEEFIKINGHGHLNALRRDCNVQNFESYLDDLLDLNNKLDLYRASYDVILKLANNHTTQQVVEYMEEKLDNVKANSEKSMDKPRVLRIDNEYIESKNQGLSRGIGYNMYTISKYTRGLHTKNVSMLAGYTNTGKSTINFSEVMMELLDKGNPVFLYSNESDYSDFQDMLLVRTLVKHFKYYKLTRTKLNTMDDIKKKNPEEYNDLQIHIRLAQQYIDQHYGDKLVLHSTSKYSIGEFNMLMRRYATKGFRHFLVDTMKAEDAGDVNSVGKLVQQSRGFYELARKLDVHVMVSYQIASYLKQTMKRIIDESCLSGSKQIAEILDILITIRELYPDEYPGGKNELKIYKLKQVDTPQGKPTYVREYITLQTNKSYILANLPKNRYGRKNERIVYEFQGEFATLFEVGTVENLQEKAY